MNILLVDDEFYIVQGLKGLLAEKLPDDVRILEAYSAEQAKKVYRTEEVDILVTDIAMPRETGLDLITWVRGEGFSSLNILLSGHEDFAFAKAAIQLQCFRYCLKPVDSEDLLDAIRSAMEQIMREKHDLPRERQLKLVSFWRGLLTGATLPTEEAIRESLGTLKLEDTFPGSLHEQSYCFFLLSIQPKKAGYIDISEQVPYDALTEAAAAAFPDMEASLVSMARSAYMLCMHEPAEGAFEASLYTEKGEGMVSGLEERFPGFRFALYTMAPTALYSAFYAYELLSRYASSLLASKSCVLPVLEVAGKSADEETAADTASVGRWRAWFEEGRSDDVLRELRMTLCREGGVVSVKRLSFLYYSLLNMVFSVLSEADIGMTETIARITGHADMVNATSSIENFLFWTERLLTNGHALLAASRQSSSTSDSVRKYIRDHISDPELSRNAIAEAVHVSPDYLSYLFKKETGEVLSSFIANERIQTARKLLRTTDLPLHAIAAESGFSNETYFHKQFKKLTGVTPNAYRTSARGK